MMNDYDKRDITNLCPGDLFQWQLPTSNQAQFEINLFLYRSQGKVAWLTKNRYLTFDLNQSPHTSDWTQCVIVCHGKKFLCERLTLQPCDLVICSDMLGNCTYSYLEQRHMLVGLSVTL